MSSALWLVPVLLIFLIASESQATEEKIHVWTAPSMQKVFRDDTPRRDETCAEAICRTRRA